PSSAWETTLQAPLAVTGSGASGTAFPSRAWEGADDKIPLTFICRGDGQAFMSVRRAKMQNKLLN
ncbi:MAG: hypothetical protein CVV06_15485, partial [Gammaproteobacteria bacterium HGW-Gammaproteobacteria-10]